MRSCPDTDIDPTNSRELLESQKQAWLGKTALRVTLKNIMGTTHCFQVNYNFLLYSCATYIFTFKFDND